MPTDSEESRAAEDPADGPPTEETSVPLQLRIVTHSEIGLVRKNNQDSGFAGPRLLVVADGMGGAAAGDLASAVAIDTIRRIDTPATGEEMLELLAGAIHRANDRIADLVEDDYSLEGMGTTVTGALFDGAELGLAHIGDSRAYLLRGGELRRLTHDHSWVQSLVDDGKISEAEASVHPHRSLLLRVLNGQVSSEPDMSLVRVQAGDRLLFCSDGLCGLVDDEDIAATLAEPDLRLALGRLVELALEAGGIDNITVILADVVTEAGTDDSAVLGAAAERDVPPVDTKEAAEDTIVTRRLDPGADGPNAAASGPGETEVEDEARYNPRAPHRRRAVRPILLIAAALLVLAAGLGAAYSWTQTQYYVGAAGDQVAIFKGISESVPGVPLSQVYEVQPIAVADLPPYYQERVRATIDVGSLDAARVTVQELADAVKRCAGKTPTSNGSGSPKPTGSSTPKSTTNSTPKSTTSPKPAESSPAKPAQSTPERTTPAPTTAAPTGRATPEPQC
ncbi:PP2C family protein-serine/threonine phosphatase [Microlunatus ginsengisoli]|uniref:Protein phosphatase 2C domain-containing protein n=1 Tax=Microlunatus ginsengisoli TaxID=363863 RepID=A0ABP7ADB4_9ACTN